MHNFCQTMCLLGCAYFLNAAVAMFLEYTGKRTIEAYNYIATEDKRDQLIHLARISF